MKINYRELKSDELNQKLTELKQELFNLRFSHATGQLSNPMEMVRCKKDIARVKTVIREREIAKERSNGRA
jgi:large subunit ribosomal protein L29